MSGVYREWVRAALVNWANQSSAEGDVVRIGGDGQRLWIERNGLRVAMIQVGTHPQNAGDHSTACLRHPMHWPDADDGKPGFERIVGGPDAECSCWEWC